MQEDDHAAPEASPITRSIRRRVLLACLAMGMTAVAVVTGTGIGFRHVLHAKARSSCMRIAHIYGALAQRRLSSFTAEAAALAHRLASRSGGLASSPPQPGVLDDRAVANSWAVYDASGRRLCFGCSDRHRAALEAVGVCTPQVVARERARVSMALTGHASIVLVPGRSTVYALHYVPLQREGKILAALQVAAEMTDPAFSSTDDTADARVVLRPFMADDVSASTIELDGKPHLVVHHPLEYCDRRLGTITAAVAFEEEARYQQGSLLAILAIVLCSLLVLALISCILADVVTKPLTHPAHANVAPKWDPAHAPEDEEADLKHFPDAVLELLASAVQTKDPHVGAHSRRVAKTALAMARELGWSDASARELQLGALLHDLGKVNIGDIRGTRSRSRLPSDAHDHPFAGARVLSQLPGCEPVLRMVLYHHENFNGTGYPTGAKGESIPTTARIIAIADYYDSIFTEHPENEGLTQAEIVELLQGHSGAMFDPDLLKLFLQLLDRGTLPEPPQAADADTTDRRPTTLPSLDGVTLTESPGADPKPQSICEPS